MAEEVEVVRLEQGDEARAGGSLGGGSPEADAGGARPGDPVTAPLERMLAGVVRQPALPTLCEAPDQVARRVAEVMRDEMLSFAAAYGSGAADTRAATEASWRLWALPVLLLRRPPDGDGQLEEADGLPGAAMGPCPPQADLTLGKILKERLRYAEIGRAHV